MYQYNIMYNGTLYHSLYMYIIRMHSCQIKKLGKNCSCKNVLKYHFGAHFTKLFYHIGKSQEGLNVLENRTTK